MRVLGKCEGCGNVAALTAVPCPEIDRDMKLCSSCSDVLKRLDDKVLDMERLLKKLDEIAVN